MFIIFPALFITINVISFPLFTSLFHYFTFFFLVFGSTKVEKGYSKVSKGPLKYPQPGDGGSNEYLFSYFFLRSVDVQETSFCMTWTSLLCGRALPVLLLIFAFPIAFVYIISTLTDPNEPEVTNQIVSGSIGIN